MNKPYSEPARISISILVAVVLVTITVLLLLLIMIGLNYISSPASDLVFYFGYLLGLFVLIPIIWVFVAIWLGRKLSTSDRRIPELSYFLAIVAFPAAYGTVCFTSFAWIGYESKMEPYPPPYSSSSVEETWRDVGHGEYGTITYEYEVEQSISEVEAHYILEMRNYCAEGWQFEIQAACSEYLVCQIAGCEIPRPFVPEAQFFRVLLQSETESNTHVTYWVKKLNGLCC